MNPTLDSYNVYSDEELLQLIAARDSKALESLYERHAQIVYNLIFRIVRNQEIADEILQESFWQVWQKANDFRGGTAAAWFYRIARNKSLDQLRRQDARPQPLLTGSEQDEEEMWNTLSEPQYEVDHLVEQRWDRQAVHKALHAIPAEQRRCLELAYFEGMSQSQIAQLTDTPLGTIKTRIRLGLQKLEHLLRASF